MNVCVRACMCARRRAERERESERARERESERARERESERARERDFVRFGERILLTKGLARPLHVSPGQRIIPPGAQSSAGR